MRSLLLTALCVSFLSACGDTYQAVPVDAVSTEPLAPPQKSHHWSDL